MIDSLMVSYQMIWLFDFGSLYIVPKDLYSRLHLAVTLEVDYLSGSHQPKPHPITDPQT